MVTNIAHYVVSMATTTKIELANYRMNYWIQFLRFDYRSTFDMEWTCAKIANKISRSLGIMCKLKRFLPQEMLRISHDSLILPHLQYCRLSWGVKSDRLFKQKRAVRIITCSRYNAHKPLLKTHNLLKIEDTSGRQSSIIFPNSMRKSSLLILLTPNAIDTGLYAPREWCLTCPQLYK